MQQTIDNWLDRFGLDAILRPHVARVVALVPVASPAFGRPGRSVVLKRTLRHRPADFIRYIIAHEFAHAHLRNGGRWPGDDPERAADALAAEWGFGRP